MPFHAGDDLGFLVGVDGDDFRVTFRRLCRGVDVQLTEMAAEILVLVESHLLISEEDHLMLHQRIVQFLIGSVAERLRNIDAADFGADHRA